MSNDKRILIRGETGQFGEPIGTFIVDPGDLTDGAILQWVDIRNSTGETVITQEGDGSIGLPVAINTNSHNRLYNGSTFDRERSNTEETFLSAAGRTATINSADFTNWNAKGLHVIIDVSAIGGTPSITPFIQGKDPVSGNYYDILEGLPITTVSLNIIKIFPGISAIVNVSASDILPRTYRVRVEHADANTIFYSVAGALVI